jgi:hypothetical protein
MTPVPTFHSEYAVVTFIHGRERRWPCAPQHTERNHPREERGYQAAGAVKRAYWSREGKSVAALLCKSQETPGSFSCCNSG